MSDARVPLICVMGVSGAGKSVVGELMAQRWGVPFVDGDDLHPEANIEKMAAGVPLDDEDRGEWLDAVGEQFAAAAAHGVVIACSALKRHYRDRIREYASGVRFVHLSVPETELERRLRERAGHFMPASLLASQLATLEPLQVNEAGLTVESVAEPAAMAEHIVAQFGSPAVRD